MEKQSHLKSVGNQTENQKKSLYEIYTTYINPSDIILDHYRQKQVYDGQETYLEELNQWLDDQSQINKPFILKSSPGMGTKTVLTSWYQKLQQKNETSKQKNLIVTHFASLQSNCSNYFYCLYRIITKLRESLKIEQKVDLLQEKIRKYFAYWLDICNSEIEKQQVIFCKENIYKKIIIIIEGVHLFKQAQSGSQANIAFWLPDKFPKNIKVLCTVGRGSESEQFFQKKGWPILDMKLSEQIGEKMLHSIMKTPTILNEQIEYKLKDQLKELYNKLASQNNSQIYKILDNFKGFLLPTSNFGQKYAHDFIKKIITENVKQKQLIKRVHQIKTLTNLFQIVFQIWQEALPCKKKLTQNLLYLSLSQKGLIPREIVQLTKCTDKQWKIISQIFNHVMFVNQQNYSIKCKVLTEFLFQRQKSYQGNSTSHSHYPQKQSSILLKQHERIAECLQNTSNSIRKLEQQTYHLFTAKSYFKLKQIMSNVENFLLLFNSNNKYELTRYWQKLQQKGFDPVIEYNKSIEGFSMHYHPSDQNIFRIIVQISRFLKEFCDFQTYDTPKFRHPIIQGNKLELHKIGLLKEFTQLQICVDNSFNDNTFLNKDQITDATLEEQIKQIREKYFPKNASQINLDQFEDQNPKKSKLTSTPKPIEISNSLVPIKSIRSKDNQNCQISEIQKINVDVPKSRDKFREHYLKILQQFMKTEQYDQTGNQQGCFIVNYDEKSSSGVISSHQIAPQPQILQTFQNDLSAAKIKESYRYKPVKPSLYYYKRWIWIQFPWVCISLNNNYSNTPEFLLRNLEGRDIDTYEQQAKYTKQALMIAIQAKQKKKQMFVKKNQNQFNSTTVDRMGASTFKVSKNNNNMNTTSLAMRNTSLLDKYGTNRFGQAQKSSARSRITQKTFTNIDLSLNALTKELENRKKKLPPGISLQNGSTTKNSPTFFLSEINQNEQQQNDCQDDLKFINNRKNFNPPNITNIASNQILPKLKWTIKDHTNYEINYIKSHIEQKRKKLNKIIYENKKLAQTYKQLKLKQNLAKKSLQIDEDTQLSAEPTIIINQDNSDKQRQNQNQNGQNINIEGDGEVVTPNAATNQSLVPFTSQKCQKNAKLVQLLKKKQSVIEQFCKSVLQKQRLKIILKLCAQNKTKNQQSLSSLNYFLQSLKKMIQHQKNNLKQLTRQISGIKLIKQKKNMMQQQKIKNQRVLEKQAKNYLQEKNKLETQIQNISTVIGEELRIEKDRLENMFTGHIKSKEQRDVIVMQEKKNKIMEQKLEEVRSQWQALKDLFGVQQGENGIQNTQKFKEMLEQNERNKKLKIIYFEKKNKLEEVKRQYQKLKEKHDKEIALSHISPKTVQNLQTQPKTQKMSKQQMQLKIILSNLALKLGVKQIQDIVPCLKDKMSKLKNNNIEKYTQIMQMAKKHHNQDEVTV